MPASQIDFQRSAYLATSGKTGGGRPMYGGGTILPYICLSSWPNTPTCLPTINSTYLKKRSRPANLPHLGGLYATQSQLSYIDYIHYRQNTRPKPMSRGHHDTIMIAYACRVTAVASARHKFLKSKPPRSHPPHRHRWHGGGRPPDHGRHAGHGRRHRGPGSPAGGHRGHRAPPPRCSPAAGLSCLERSRLRAR